MIFWALGIRIWGLGRTDFPIPSTQLSILNSQLETQAMTQDEIYEKVQDTLVDALGLEPDEVTPDATLAGDLGAESIDYLDIVFRLEKAFGVKIPRGELFPESLASAEGNFVKDGIVTDEGIAELRTRMPHADVDSFAADPKVENIQELFTVNMLVKFMDKKVNE